MQGAIFEEKWSKVTVRIHIVKPVPGVYVRTKVADRRVLAIR